MSNDSGSFTFDNAILIRLRSGQPGWVKSSRAGQEILAKEAGAKASVSVKLLPASMVSALNKPKNEADRIIKAAGVPWTLNKVDNRGNRKEDAWQCVDASNIPQVERRVRQCRQMREEAIGELVKRLPAFKAEARREQGPLFDESHWPEPEQVSDMFFWEVDIMPLMSLPDIEADLRLKLPKEWAEEQIQKTREDYGKRAAYAIASVAEEVAKDFLDKKEGYVGKLRSHSTSTEDGRKGVKFREAPFRQKVETMRDRLANVNSMFKDEALGEVITKLDDIVRELNGIPKNALQHDESGAVRNKIANKLEDAANSAKPAQDRLADLLG